MPRNINEVLYVHEFDFWCSILYMFIILIYQMHPVETHLISNTVSHGHMAKSRASLLSLLIDSL